MRIRIAHDIVHRFSPPARSLVQNLRLTPRGYDAQYVLRWRVAVDVDGALRRSEDAFGNVVHSFSHHGALEAVTIRAEGEVETSDAVGVVRGAVEPLPAEMFLRASPFAQVGGALRDFAAEAVVGATSELDKLHRLMGAVHDAMSFDPIAAEAVENAPAAFALRRGDSKDHAHVFIAAARWLGTPARFVSGYAAPGEETVPAGVHAWAEAYDPLLGWVAFDPVGCVCPGEGYVRVTVGFDGQDCAPARYAFSGGEDHAEASVRVEQSGAQQQN